MSQITLLLPNQLFADHPGVTNETHEVVLFEDPLFFGDAIYPAKMHKQKLWLHRATMARYREGLAAKDINARIVSHDKAAGSCMRLFQDFRASGVSKVIMAEPVDFIAEKRLRAAAVTNQIDLEIRPSPGFLNTTNDNLVWSSDRSRWFMAEFYKYQRRRLDVLMEGDQPSGGQWSFDAENRKKIPKSAVGKLPWIDWPTHDAIDLAAKNSVLAEYPEALGSLETLYFPTSHGSAEQWLAQFLERRFDSFGKYEDAIVEGENWLLHSVLTPALNIGLLTPQQVLDAALNHADKSGIPLNSVEGFVRQIIGWREFMRATYEALGTRMRTTNHWGHQRKMPSAFYEGTTGIDPIDDTIRRVLKTGYCHHIERLMVLGGFMFLCEIDPNDVYRWFMEMFVDSYDWVMVPNTYAMSQHADGGLITTKPYFSGSNYIRKMSHWGKGPWADQWDALYWRFIFKHADTLASNPRWAMMCRMAQKMPADVRESHVDKATAFLDQLDSK